MSTRTPTANPAEAPGTYHRYGGVRHLFADLALALAKDKRIGGMNWHTGW
ncbi:hypothetical protein [Streptomyces virginiae]